MMKLPFLELKIWQKAVDLANAVYDATDTYPPRELYGLRSQSNRSATSVASNIAEGSQRTTDKDFANFILIAKGSLAELYTQLIIANRRKFLRDSSMKNLFEKIDELNRMLFSFHRKLTAAR